eukprot:749821-Hanusia_phi.AAC.17
MKSPQLVTRRGQERVQTRSGTAEWDLGGEDVTIGLDAASQLLGYKQLTRRDECDTAGELYKSVGV